jgi:hypothetical protein
MCYSENARIQMNTNFLDVDSLKKALIGIKKRKLELEYLMRPLREEHDKITQIEHDLAGLVQTLGVNIGELYKEIEAEPVEIDFTELIDTLREKMAGMPQVQETMRLADAAYLALLSIDQPAHYKQIAQAIKERRFNIPGKNPESNLLAHMSNDKKRFAKAEEAGRGFWKLAEWDKK